MLDTYLLDGSLQIVYFILLCMSLVVMASPIVLVQTAWDEVCKLETMDFNIGYFDYDA